VSLKATIRLMESYLMNKYYIVGGLVLLLVVTAATAVFIRRNMAPDDLDTATAKLSESGLYHISFTPAVAPVPINQMHSWTLHVRTADGEPVEDAVITVSGDMPQHRHGMPTRPQVTANLGNGDYLVEGIRFQMGGWWVMDFEISAPGRHDRVRFNLILDR
jgi:hypothetical protein